MLVFVQTKARAPPITPFRSLVSTPSDYRWLILPLLIIPSLTVTEKAYFQLLHITFSPYNLVIRYSCINIMGEHKEIVTKKQILSSWSKFQSIALRGSHGLGLRYLISLRWMTSRCHLDCPNPRKAEGTLNFTPVGLFFLCESCASFKEVWTMVNNTCMLSKAALRTWLTTETVLTCREQTFEVKVWGGRFLPRPLCSACRCLSSYQVLVCLGRHNNTPQTACLEQEKFVFSQLWKPESKIKVLAWSGSGERSLLSSETATFSLSSHFLTGWKVGLFLFLQRCYHAVLP